MFLITWVLYSLFATCLSYQIAYVGRYACNVDPDWIPCPIELYNARSFYYGLVDGGFSANGQLPGTDIEVKFYDPTLVGNVSDPSWSPSLTTFNGENGYSLQTALNLVMNDSSNPIIAVAGLESDCRQISGLSLAYNKALVVPDCYAEVGESHLPNEASVEMGSTQGAKYRALGQLLHSMNWTTVAVFNFYDADDSARESELAAAFSENGIQITEVEGENFYVFSGMYSGAEMMIQAIQRNYLKTRIFILIAAFPDDHDLFMDVMANMGLLESGKYFVIVMNVIRTDSVNYAAYSNRRDKFNYNRYDRFVPSFMMRQYYRSMFFFTDLPQIPQNYSTSWMNYLQRVQTDLNKTFACPPMCNTVQSNIVQETPLDAYTYNNINWQTAANSYDAGRVLAEALKQYGKNINLTDGTQLADLLNNMTYTSVLGYKTTFDTVGIAQRQYVLWSPQNAVYRLSLPQWAIPAVIMTPDGNGNFTYNWSDIPSLNILYNKLPAAVPPCGFSLELCPQTGTLTNVEIIIIAVCAIVGLLTIGVLIGISRWIMYERRLESSYFLINRNEVQLQDLSNFGSMKAGSDIFTSVMSLKSGMLQDVEEEPKVGTMQFYETNIKTAYRRKNAPSKKSRGIVSRDDMWKEISDWHLAKYTNQLVTVRKVKKMSLKLTRDMKQELDLLMSTNHENLNKFYGIIIEGDLIFTLHQYGPRKSLNDLLRNVDLRLDRMFRVSFVEDVMKGIRFLHEKSKIAYHGNLKSTNCVVDAYWRIKLSNFGLEHIREDEPKPNLDDQLWCAPEILRVHSKLEMSKDELRMADIYSLGIILYEIYGRQGPFGDDLLDSKEIIEQLKFPSGKTTRPDMELIKSAPMQIKDIVVRCWEEDPKHRPVINKVREFVKPISKGLKGNIADNIMQLLDRYKNNLEDVIKERTEELEEERRRNEMLLLQLLPSSVAESLKNGRPVDAEFFDAVTIYFSDIVGFTALSSKSTPMQVVDMLNDLYTAFDTIIDKFDCYKVETIGDAYMFVSGLPDLNAYHHAGEVASASLELLGSIQGFTVRHCPDERLRLRIGLHTGAVVTGVVGVRMPRYCLFGDTVITASNMESSGEPMKIQVSNDTYKLLVKCGGYETELRGEIQLKSKAKMTSYWLNSYSKDARLNRLKDDRNVYPVFEKLIRKAQL